MQQSAASASTDTSTSFAGLLAAFAEPKGFEPAPDDDGAGDDIFTLSYEHALRTHSRYGAPETNAGNSKPPLLPGVPAQPASSTAPKADVQAAVASAPTPHCSKLVEQNLKRATITIRLSRQECAQLHERAAEAGLTVSAYLRSCTLEVEKLRAQVKETLAQIRSAASGQDEAKPAGNAESVLARLWRRCMPRANQRAVRA